MAALRETFFSPISLNPPMFQPAKPSLLATLLALALPALAAPSFREDVIPLRTRAFP